MSLYVITGGPGVGKTTVIEILASLGYSIVPEAARIIIEEEVSKNSDILPWINLAAFQQKVAERQLHAEYAIKETAFLDRSIIDGHAYSILGKVKVPEIIISNASGRYEQIFLLDPLPLFVKDKSRWEDRDTSIKIRLEIEKSYKTFGYKIVKVPVLPPLERVEFILSHTNKKKQS